MNSSKFLQEKLKKRTKIIALFLGFFVIIIGVFAFVLLYWMNNFDEKVWINLIFLLLIASIIIGSTFFIVICFIIRINLIEKRGKENELDSSTRAIFALFLTKRNLALVEKNSAVKRPIIKLDFIFFILSSFYISHNRKNINFFKGILFNLISLFGLIIFVFNLIGIVTLFILAWLFSISLNSRKKTFSK